MENSKNPPEKPRIPNVEEIIAGTAGANYTAAYIPEVATTIFSLDRDDVTLEERAKQAEVLAETFDLTWRDSAEKTSDGTEQFELVDASGQVHYTGPKESTRAQLAILFVRYQSAFADRPPAGSLMRNKPVKRVESSRLVTPQKSEISEADILSRGELTAYDLLAFAFGPAKRRLQKDEANFDGSAVYDTVVEDIVPPQYSTNGARHAARPERIVGKMRRKVVTGAMATVAMLSGVLLSSDSSIKTSHEHATHAVTPKPHEPRGKHRKTESQQTITEVHEPAGDFRVTANLTGEIQFITGTMNDGRNPWQMTVDALHIAGITVDETQIHQADPYLQNAQTIQAAQHLGAGAVMRWQVVHENGLSRLVPQPLPYQR